MPESEENMRIRKLMRTITLLSALLALQVGAPAYANVPKSAEADTEPAEIVEAASTPAPTPTPVPTPTSKPDITYAPLPEVSMQPFTIAGNAEVLDDITDGSKEFYTITTSNNNSFFIVVDRARTTENVYMLAKVNEDDIAEFIENYSAPTPTPAPTMQILLPTPAPTPQVITVEPEKKGDKMLSYGLIGAMGLAIIGGGWYFKVYKPKHEDYDDDDEGMEYDDSDEESDD